MFCLLLFLCMQSFLLYAAENPLSFYQKDQVRSLVTDFLKIHNISDKSPDTDSAFKTMKFLFEKSISLNLIEKIIEVNQVLIDSYAKNPELDNNNKALKIQAYINKLEKIKQLEERTITKLKKCCQMPIEASKPKHYNKQYKTLQQLWHCYWLHTIPNTQLKISESEKTCFTYDKISEIHMECLHYWLDNEVEKFLELFNFPKDHTLADIDDALYMIIPRLQIFIKNKEKEQDEENNEPSLEPYNYMITSFRLLSEQCARYTKNGCLDEDTYPTRLKISRCWESFWETPTIYNAKIFCKLLADYISCINDVSYKKAINKNSYYKYCTIV